MEASTVGFVHTVQDNAAPIATVTTTTPHTNITYVPVVDHEADAFRAEIAALLPEGDALGMAEARVDVLLERIGQAQERIARLDGAARARMKMIRDSTDEEIGKLSRQVAYIESVIRMNLPGDAEHFRRHYGKQSIVLPHGTAGIRALKSALVIGNMDAAVAWAAKHEVPVAEKIERKVAKADVMKWIEKNNGEVPDFDGLEFVDGSEKFYVTPRLSF